MYKLFILERNTWNYMTMCKLFVFDRDTLSSYNCAKTNDYHEQISELKRIQKNIENIVMITVKGLQIKQILALDNPEGVDILLNEETKVSLT